MAPLFTPPIRTGILDKNNKEIEFGDVIKVQFHTGAREMQVWWCNGAFKLMETKSMLEGAADGWLHEIISMCQCSHRMPQPNIEIIAHAKAGR